jgi:DNA-binding SARP family transcriptional activator
MAQLAGSLSAAKLLTRPRLLRRLQAALRRGHVSITAPGGYGKTVLLHTLAAQRPNTHYLALSPAEADLAILQARLKGLTASSDAAVLLDDLHYLNDIPETLDWLTNQLTQTDCRFVLCGRQLELPLGLEPLTRFTTADLIFTPQESRALLSAYQAGTADAWHSRTDGWPLALVLLSRLPQTPADKPPPEIPLFDHLAAAFFTNLPPDLLHFAHLTAIPLRFNLELAALLLQTDVTNAQAMLAEAQRRSLFLEAVEPSGWFRYHILVREFLIANTAINLKPLYQQVVDWFIQHDDFEQAIEHALAGQLYEQAAQLLLAVPLTFVREQGRHLTYRRWVLSLPDATLTQNPTLLIHLGQHLFLVAGYADEAWQYVNRADALARQTGNHPVVLQAGVRQGLFLFRSGNYEQARLTLEPLLADPALTGPDRRLALRVLCNALGEMARYRQARRTYLEAIHLAQTENDLAEELFNRQNLAITTLAPLGDFTEAESHMQAALNHYLNVPGLRLRCLLMSCDLHFFKGDWAGLEQALQEMEALSRQLDTVEAADQLWPSLYKALLETGRSNFTAARQLLARFASLIVNDYPMARISEAWLEVWLLRRENRLPQAIQRAETLLAGNIAVPYYRAQIALHRDIARQFLLTSTDPPLMLHPETRHFIAWRTRADLVHLRALLALECWRVGHPRWQRHARAARRALARPGYERLLTTRDPDLGASFWAMCLATEFEVEPAMAALKEIGLIEPVVPLLDDKPDRFQKPVRSGVVRARAARALAAIGHEAAIPALDAALKSETNPATVAALEAALTRLESQPPPWLEIQLMGDFAVHREGQPITDWPRPIVRRLLQYFALHRGQPLPRDQILDDLWPNTDPASAYTTFRTVHSRLRSVLQPYLRPKVPSRYFAVEGDTYRFDPFDRVKIDIEQFEYIVRTVLREADQHDLPPLSEDLLAALTNWRPLLPDLPYEEWLIPRRETLHTLYVEGCLYVAQAYLAHDELHQAMQWAQQSLAEAPWLEEAYQTLMRGHARLNERSLALKVYETAVTALERELGAPPSRLTTWLVERLRRGEEI